AQRLGWSLGTFRRRLQRGRAWLRQRLIRRGFPLSAILAGLVGTEEAAQAVLPFRLAQSTVQSAMRAALAGPTAQLPPPTIALTYGVLKGTWIVAIVGFLTALLLPAVLKVRDVANRTQCANHLHQIGLALLHYHDQFGSFPPGLDNMP